MSSNDPFSSSTNPLASQAQAALNLRPLPLGELFDRAFQVYFSNVWALTALLAIVLVPYTIINYFQTKDLWDVIFSAMQQGMHGGTPPPPDITKLQGAQTWAPFDWLIVVIAIPIANAAVIVGVSRAYLGQPVRFKECYKAALHRWLPLLILVVLWFIAAFISILIVAIVMAILIPSSIGMATVFGRSGFAGFMVALFFFILFIVLFAIAVMVYLAFAFSFIATVLERVDPVKAFASGFARVFSRDQLWRGFLLAIALGLIEIAAGLVGGGAGGVAAYFLKSPALYFIGISLVQLFFYPFAFVVVSIFYYDIRIRREGFDLQMLIDRLAATQSSTARPA